MTHRNGSAALVAVLLTLGAMAQDRCADYHTFNCERSTDARFSINGQSKSASVQVGTPTELNIIVYRGQDYRVSFCYDEKVIGDHVVARLVEKIRVPEEEKRGVVTKTEQKDADGNTTGAVLDKTEKKGLFKDERKVLWDNTEHDLAQSIEFSCTATKRLVIEVMAPGVAEPKGRSKDLDIGCVGILIEHMPTPNLGF
ncbi:MAG: hypothetical protein IPK99_00630 [Flavobacteriales bacterium]|nr:hypothetical protein [Flavobacteriales bacterium]